MSLEELFPPSGLRVTAGPVELRPLRDDDLAAYAALVTDDLYPGEEREADFVFGWWHESQREGALPSLRWIWRQRADFTPAAWRFTLGVFEGGRLIGMQDLGATDFAVLRLVTSGSLLHPDARGRGLGTLMRRAVLTLAFDHLGAVRAESRATLDNARSRRVSAKVGYIEDGTALRAEGDQAITEVRMVVTPDSFIRGPEPVTVAGLTPALRRMLGAV